VDRMTSVGDEDPVVRRVQDELARQGRTLLGPETLPDDPSGERHGWFAPVVTPQRRGGAAPYGWGRTPGAAAQDALAQFPSEGTA
jgi:hypothetical protein